LPIIIGIVFPLKGDAFFVHCHKAVIAYCHPMRITSGILHDSLRSREGRLDIPPPGMTQCRCG
jgi:hypothetical protein